MFRYVGVHRMHKADVINEFANTPVGQKLFDVQADMLKKLGPAGEELANKKTATGAWRRSFSRALKREFPEWSR